ncbi:MAG: hypothetical protein NC299_03530 [Lachnospiraceae bacterium]|nr:hypothetical protein [Ruminococcus sp.]MCM1274421.1 hypothetical protein [Lachnospiraceae bacterium]
MSQWTFKKERHKTPPDGLRIFLCGSENEYVGYDECALVLGKLYSLFGEPILGADFDSTYVYEIIAETSEKETAYLTIDEHDNRAAVLYSANAEDAARALAEAVGAAQPADYEYNWKETEAFRWITYFAKDGKAGHRDRAMTIMEIFDGDPSPEDIEQFSELGYDLG